MWRTFASLALMFLAVAWSAFAVIAIFVIVPGVWETVLGRSGGVIGALAALGGVVWSSGKLMRWADNILNESDHRASAAAAGAADPAQDVDVPRDWHTYNAEIARSKRWAFYRRTRQFDRLAELERQPKGAKQS
jgi:hypothetical protein